MTITLDLLQYNKNFVLEEKLDNKANIDADNFSSTGYDTLSGLSFPSENYIELTVSSSPTTFTAPADGWVLIRMASTSSSCFVALNYVKSDIGYPTNYLGAYTRATASGQGTRVMLPVGKGNQFTVEYYDATLTNLIFAYAKGAEAEEEEE